MKDDNIIRVRLDPQNPTKGKTNWEKVKEMTEEEIEKAAETDSDCLPLSQQELSEFRPISVHSSIS